ncbi:MAG TPA: hypothetical protein VGO31_14720 [Microbacteriaceae bacterium]|jgi:hypothetical protein|nr:hypothetical protein [Microbacteriaceae bacterium]
MSWRAAEIEPLARQVGEKRNQRRPIGDDAMSRGAAEFGRAAFVAEVIPIIDEIGARAQAADLVWYRRQRGRRWPLRLLNRTARLGNPTAGAFVAEPVIAGVGAAVLVPIRGLRDMAERNESPVDLTEAITPPWAELMALLDASPASAEFRQGWNAEARIIAGLCAHLRAQIQNGESNRPTVRNELNFFVEQSREVLDTTTRTLTGGTSLERTLAVLVDSAIKDQPAPPPERGSWLTAAVAQTGAAD